MAIFKCKMCGGSLDVSVGTSVIECEYCGTAQTLPKLDDDRRANLYDRANRFRRSNEFDKAAGIQIFIAAACWTPDFSGCRGRGPCGGTGWIWS